MYGYNMHRGERISPGENLEKSENSNFFMKKLQDLPKTRFLY